MLDDQSEVLFALDDFDDGSVDLDDSGDLDDSDDLDESDDVDDASDGAPELGAAPSEAGESVDSDLGVEPLFA